MTKNEPKIYYRNCPSCNTQIKYGDIGGYNRANRKISLCQSCCRIGEKNGFYGRKHTSRTIEKIKETSKNSDKRKQYYIERNKPENLKKIGEKSRLIGANRGMGFYKHWVVKYGKKIADEKMIEYKKKQSKNNARSMYGRSPSKRAGSGWSGQYKGMFFRSLLELSFIVKVAERFNFDYKSAETKEYMVKYNYNRRDKTYKPDFVLNNYYVVECKPYKLQQIDENVVKFEKAIKHFNKKGLKFKVMDCKLLNIKELIDIISGGELEWTKKTQDKFDKKLEKHYSDVEFFNEYT